MSQTKYDWDKVLALSAVFIAVVAAAASIWQGYLMEKHNRLSIMPRLELEQNYSHNGSYSAYLNNNGLGPADVTEVEYFVDGKSVGNDLNKLLAELELNPECTGRGGLRRFYKVADRQLILRTEINELCANPPLPPSDLSRRINLVVHYVSMYGDKQTLDTRR